MPTGSKIVSLNKINKYKKKVLGPPYDFRKFSKILKVPLFIVRVLDRKKVCKKRLSDSEDYFYMPDNKQKHLKKI